MSSPAITRRGAQKAKIQTRAMIRKQFEMDCNSKKTVSLQEIKKQARQRNAAAAAATANPNASPVLLKDIYQTATNSMKKIRGETGLIFDRRMIEHRCIWDPEHIERPERFTRILDRCTELGLINRCKELKPRNATEAEILTKHTKEHFDLLKSTSQYRDEEIDKIEELCSNYDTVFIHPTTFDLSVLATGSTIELIEQILNGTIQNGMAIIRPPGHHAMKSEYNGFCLFNNVAIAAQWALDQGRAEKILIVDWDVHHGQGTQRMFYNDRRVLYFSIHRYEFGAFWPNLRESDFDSIGDGDGRGFNFNLPLNRIGMTNGDYLAIFQQILMPIAIEYQPDLIIVSAGYDAAFGCVEGEMEVTPACYAHLLSPLLTLAGGKVAVVLEGGYCLDSLSEGAAITLKTLLGDPCPNVVDPIDPPSESIQESILNCIYLHRPFWKCLQLNDTYSLEELNNLNPQPEMHQIVKVFKGLSERPDRYPTRNTYPVQTIDCIEAIAKKLANLKSATKLNFPTDRVGYVYDLDMLQHKNVHYVDHPEKPERLEAIVNRFIEYGLFERMRRIDSRSATTDELCSAHTRQHVNLIRRTVERDDLFEIGETYNSVYFHPKTFDCATLAAGSVLQVVDAVLQGKCLSGVCIVRPPGHHAEQDEPHGFCIFNNVAIGAQYAIKEHGLKRVLIVDWDVHHGNGTQHIFDKNSNVLYISLHRYDHGTFFPKCKDGDYTAVGKEQGEGFNVNIPWNKKGMGDMEYVMAFQKIIMPIAYEFNPELVLVSAGFDAAIGDPLGGCKVTPEAYGYFTHWLSALANGRIVICLEGGYNVNSISYAMAMCTKALLGDPLPILQNSQKINSSCVETIDNVLSIHQKYWKSLKFNKKLPNYDDGETPTNDDDDVCKAFEQIQIADKVKSHADQDSMSDNSKGSGNLNDDATPSSSGLSSSGNKSEANQTLSDYLAENIQALQKEDMYAVYPLTDCPHLSLLQDDSTLTAINTKQSCSQCNSQQENWFCLHCYQTYCGRYINEHMLYHHLETEHPLTLSYADLSVWCYKCENYIDNPRLFKYKNLAHLDKFDEEMIWSYGNDTLVLEFQNS